MRRLVAYGRGAGGRTDDPPKKKKGGWLPLRGSRGEQSGQRMNQDGTSIGAVVVGKWSAPWWSSTRPRFSPAGILACSAESICVHGLGGLQLRKPRCPLLFPHTVCCFAVFSTLSGVFCASKLVRVSPSAPRRCLGARDFLPHEGASLPPLLPFPLCHGAAAATCFLFSFPSAHLRKSP